MPFSDISGHIKEIEILKRAIIGQRVAHAYLFSGPEGIGKRLVALEFAKALNCGEGKGDPCGVCADCSSIEAGTHPNLILAWPTDKEEERSPSGLIRIDRIRDIQNSVRYRIERGKKAVIMDGADRLMPQAANAFLKTLEEPPPGTVIILVTSSPSALLPTILSRCQRINFRPLAEELISAYLLEKTGLSPEAASSGARLACGSVSRAIRYVEDGAFEKRREVLERLSRISPDDTYSALKLAEELSKRDDLEEVFEFMKSWYRDKLVLLEGEDRLVVNSDMAGYALKGDADRRRIIDSFSMIEAARRDIMPPRYANRQLTLEVLIMRITGCTA